MQSKVGIFGFLTWDSSLNTDIFLSTVWCFIIWFEVKEGRVGSMSKPRQIHGFVIFSTSRSQIKDGAVPCLLTRKVKVIFRSTCESSEEEVDLSLKLCSKNALRGGGGNGTGHLGAITYWCEPVLENWAWKLAVPACRGRNTRKIFCSLLLKLYNCFYNLRVPSIIIQAEQKFLSNSILSGCYYSSHIQMKEEENF